MISTLDKNLHWPERIEGESFEDYKTRRKMSKAINKMVDYVPANQIQNPERNAERRLKRDIGQRQYKKMLGVLARADEREAVL